ncbi:MAG: protein translocase subunit SecF [Clostridiales bacterium]|nr:protein translocase subunit SecF [Clostridiales bacterium]
MVNFTFKNKNLKIVEKFFILVAISLAIIIAGFVYMAIGGMNLGVEFSGGSNIQITVHNFEDIDGNAFKGKVISWLEGDRDGKDGVDKNTKVYDVDKNVQSSGRATYEFRISNEMKDETGKMVDLYDIPEGSEQPKLYHENVEIRDLLTEDLTKWIVEKYNVEETSFEVEIEPHIIGNDVKNYTVRNAFIAVAVAIVVILAYIAIRFSPIAGLAAIVALLHDVLIMVSLTTIFQIPVNMTFIAAVITIVGYSINATIVVFDRVRELLALPSNIEKTDREIANEAVVGTLSRSILTTVTTLVMIAILAIVSSIMGSTAIREFAIPIIFGLVAGLYSSSFLSASVWVYLRKAFKQSNKKPNKKVKKSKAVAEVEA